MPSYCLFLPELLLAGSQTYAGAGLLVDETGVVSGVLDKESAPAGTKTVALPGKALLPGLANVHSHTFQRLFRGRSEGRTGGKAAGGDTFWTWREQMYRAAGFVSAEDFFDIARAAYLEMASTGITVVGEFHYLHRDTDGCAYEDANLLAKQAIAAARSVGLRICLLRSAYFRAGFEREPHAGQRRFYEEPDEYLRNLEDLATEFAGTEQVTVGAAPHSVRAVPLRKMKDIADFAKAAGQLPLHMHISEQVAENAACLAEYGATPVQLLADHGLLDSKTTLVHAIHLTEAEFATVSRAGTTICSCPTTERNLGDGIFPAEAAMRLGIRIALGTDSQAQIGILEDARQLEYHLRLRDQQRGILDGAARPDWVIQSPIGESLFRAASSNGYSALGLKGGSLETGEPADFFTIDLSDCSILGADRESLVAQAVFAASSSAIRDVVVQGKMILQDGQHLQGSDIRTRYRAVQDRYLRL